MISTSKCIIQTISSTQIICKTSSYNYSSIKAQIAVMINESGYALNVCFFIWNFCLSGVEYLL